MTGTDPLANALSGLDNAESVGHLDHEVEPASNEIGSVLEVLYDRGYIDGFQYVDDGKAGRFEVELKGAIN
ncbi:MAG: 30S ribosomal protein S8, partial [Haloarculaceae archaeon]